MRHPLRPGLADITMPAGPWDVVRRPPRHNDEALTGTTQAWLRKLPAGRRPQLLCMQLRVANRIAWRWCDPAQAHAVLDDLLQDRRGGRSGFPPPVVQELRRLRDDHARRAESAQEPGTLALLRRFWPRH